MMPRSFLFLQGVSSPFFLALRHKLEKEGHTVEKLNFAVGDDVYWRGRRTRFSGTGSSFADFFETLLGKLGSTDVVLFGDSRPFHLTARAICSRRGTRVHVFEEGYFRPYWVTLERNGVNGSSALPKEPDWYRRIGKQVPRYQNGEPFPARFAMRAWHDFQYHVWGAINPIVYPKYRTHAAITAPVEYFGLVSRWALSPYTKSLDDAVLKRFRDHVSKGGKFFLLPLQLDGDSQIRNYSNFASMKEVIDDVVRSFVLHASDDSNLLIKAHPFDAGPFNYRRYVQRVAREQGLEKRISFVSSGSLPCLLDDTAGVITVNSTVGSSALVHSKPVITLGQAIYDMDGLTFKDGLDAYWRNSEGPDMGLFRNFRNVVIHATQINGGFYCAPGIALAVNNSYRGLVDDESALEKLLLM